MGFWVFMLIMDLLIPLVMILLGKLFSVRVPKKINFLYGYRTAMSMKNQETWIFAHKHCGRNCFRVGLVMLPLSAIALLLLIGQDTEIIGLWGVVICLVQVVVLILAIFPTERALKQTFDKEGNLRQPTAE